MMTSTGSIALGFGLIVSIGTRAQGVLPWIWSVQIGHPGPVALLLSDTLPLLFLRPG